MIINHFRLYNFARKFRQAACDKHVSGDVVCWYVTPCSLAQICRRFKRFFYLHHYFGTFTPRYVTSYPRQHSPGTTERTSDLTNQSAFNIKTLLTLSIISYNVYCSTEEENVSLHVY
jgi:hypothetical protein